MSYDHVHYRTLTTDSIAVARFQAQHGSSAVEGPDTPFGHPLDVQVPAREELLDGYSRGRHGNARQLHPPYRGLETVCERPRACHDDVQHVEPFGQGLIKGQSYVGGFAPARHPDLEVLRLARRASR